MQPHDCAETIGASGGGAAWSVAGPGIVRVVEAAVVSVGADVVAATAGVLVAAAIALLKPPKAMTLAVTEASFSLASRRFASAIRLPWLPPSIRLIPVSGWSPNLKVTPG
ncbi:MAG: hypothetical protein ACYDGR_04060 [Candidatus Dormibacteria bacterium]